ncbi:MAG: FIST N-terminal domain-containing protein [Candidatus Dactylopiibacterium sp.]|nr:FIST N-terminal domain-containing protein [Candidatus Dactylopiibacterium sp.]
MLVEPLDCIVPADAQAVEARAAALVAAGARSLLILAGEGALVSDDEWDALLRAQPVPVCGGIFPSVLVEGEALARGVLVMGMRCEASVCVVPGLGEAQTPDLAALGACLPGLQAARTVLLWVDGLAHRVDDLLGEIYDQLGAEPAFFGAGAGSASFMPRRCVFSNEGLLAESAVLMGLPVSIGLGFAHGCAPVAGPFLVSTVTSNRIGRLDFAPALEVYREEVRRLSGQEVTQQNFFSVTRAFPFGLERMDGSFLLREPVQIDGERIICVGDVSEQSTLHILHGGVREVFRAAEQACEEALASTIRPAAVLLIDCLNRARYLGAAHLHQDARIRKRLEEAGHGGTPVFGVLSVGEFASQSGNYPEFHSRTFVLGLLPHDAA